MAHAPTTLAPTQHTELPLFDAGHRELAGALAAWVPTQAVDERDDRAACRDWVRRLGQAGWLHWCVPAAFGGAWSQLDSRALVILRETLAFYSPLADFAFAMQGLGSGAITLGGTPEQQARYLPAVAQGDKIAAFALSEPEAGSDVAAMKTIATPSSTERGSHQNEAENPSTMAWTLNGCKTWISNGDLADFYCLFAKTQPEAGARGITAFIVDAGTPGLRSDEHIHVMAPHPLATLRLNDCTLPDSQRLGAPEGGFKLAMQTLDIFRASVAGAALGMARRALHEAVQHAQARPMFGHTLADFQLTQAKLGDMAALIDAAALLTYRAAWLRDRAQARGGWANPGEQAAYTSAAAMAKMTATENAQKVIDMAVQMHGGRGVQVGQVVEHLYRDIRSLRIYEGATEVQQLIIGKAVLKGVQP